LKKLLFDGKSIKQEKDRIKSKKGRKARGRRASFEGIGTLQGGL
jgi:hypothetical protein